MPLELRRLAPEGERNGLEVERETVKVEGQAPRVVRLPEKTPHPSPLPQGEREPEPTAALAAGSRDPGHQIGQGRVGLAALALDLQLGLQDVGGQAGQHRLG
jgi:hypothetical protein